MSGLVTDLIYYKYSSARNYQDDNTVLEIDDPGFMDWVVLCGLLGSAFVAIKLKLEITIMFSYL